VAAGLLPGRRAVPDRAHAPGPAPHHRHPARIAPPDVRDAPFRLQALHRSRHRHGDLHGGTGPARNGLAVPLHPAWGGHLPGLHRQCRRRSPGCGPGLPRMGTPGRSQSRPRNVRGTPAQGHGPDRHRGHGPVCGIGQTDGQHPQNGEKRAQDPGPPQGSRQRPGAGHAAKPRRTGGHGQTDDRRQPRHPGHARSRGQGSARPIRALGRNRSHAVRHPAPACARRPGQGRNHGRQLGEIHGQGCQDQDAAVHQGQRLPRRLHAQARGGGGPRPVHGCLHQGRLRSEFPLRGQRRHGHSLSRRGVPLRHRLPSHPRTRQCGESRAPQTGAVRCGHQAGLARLQSRAQGGQGRPVGASRQTGRPTGRSRGPAGRLGLSAFRRGHPQPDHDPPRSHKRRFRHPGCRRAAPGVGQDAPGPAPGRGRGILAAGFRRIAGPVHGRGNRRRLRRGRPGRSR